MLLTDDEYAEYTELMRKMTTAVKVWDAVVFWSEDPYLVSMRDEMESAWAYAANHFKEEVNEPAYP